MYFGVPLYAGEKLIPSKLQQAFIRLAVPYATHETGLPPLVSIVLDHDDLRGRTYLFRGTSLKLLENAGHECRNEPMEHGERIEKGGAISAVRAFSGAGCHSRGEPRLSSPDGFLVAVSRLCQPIHRKATSVGSGVAKIAGPPQKHFSQPWNLKKSTYKDELAVTGRPI